MVSYVALHVCKKRRILKIGKWCHKLEDYFSCYNVLNWVLNLFEENIILISRTLSSLSLEYFSQQMKLRHCCFKEMFQLLSLCDCEEMLNFPRGIDRRICWLLSLPLSCSNAATSVERWDWICKGWHFCSHILFTTIGRAVRVHFTNMELAKKRRKTKELRQNCVWKKCSNCQ